MLTQKSINLYGFVSLAAMAAMLVLIWFNLVPESLYLTLFLVALALFMIRVTLRLMLARQERMQRDQHKVGADRKSEEAPRS